MKKPSSSNRKMQLYWYRRANRTLLLIDVTYKAIFIVFVLPLLSYGLDFVMKHWGQSYITAENLPSFLAYPPTIILLLLFLFVMTFLNYSETTTLVYYGSIQGSNHKPRLLQLMGIGFRKAISCILSCNKILPFYTLLLYLFTITTILIGITIYIPMDFLRGKSDEIMIKVFLILGLLLLCFIAFPGIFALHFCVTEHKSLSSGMLLSKQLLKGRTKKTAGFLLLHNLILTILFFILYYTVLVIVAISTFLLSDRSVVISVFLSIYSKVNIYLIILFCMTAFTTNINLLSYLFHRYLAEERDVLSPVSYDIPDPIFTKNPSQRNPLIFTLVIIIIVAGMINFYISIRNDSFYFRDELFGILVCSHRGYSHVAPENTIPALENAILARSDYAEIDIQQTKDGVLVLLHDQSLRRTTGLNKNIWELTYDEVSSLDAGHWFGPEFINTPIPTLEEAMIYCKGRINLNIDVKKSIHNQNIEQTLADLIEEYDYENQCVVTSWNYDILVNIKTINPAIKTGYIMSAIYGDLFNKEFIDFYSIRSSFISKYLVDKAHSLGKEVHAWTANSPSEIERLKSIGVDCIITDNPILVQEILYRNDSNNTFIELINKMLYNRSFYKIQARQ